MKKILMMGEVNFGTGKAYYRKKCEFCKYDWLARKFKPRQCPNCKRQIKYKEVEQEKVKINK